MIAAIVKYNNIIPGSPDAIRGWSDDEQRTFKENNSYTLFKNCIGIVDGVYVRVYRPVEFAAQPRYYSYYKGYHALLFMAVTDRKGRFVYVDNGTAPGNISEATVFGRADLYLRPSVILKY